MKKRKYDFSGWATKANVKCSDGRTIMQDAFVDNDGEIVPLVWNHQHGDSMNVLGHAVLENRKDGVYAYCKFNNTESGENAKLLVEHGDIRSLSILANQLKSRGNNVVHGMIREVSLVLAGANPDAFIESVIRHGNIYDDEAVIYTGESVELKHADKKEEENEMEEEFEEIDEIDVEEITPGKKKKKRKKESEETVQDVVDTMSEKQKNVMYALIGQAIEDGKDDEESREDDKKERGGKNIMKHNIFDSESSTNTDEVLTHSEMQSIFADAKRGTLKDAVLAHGIENIDYLFPEAKNVTNIPGFIQRDIGWVPKVMNGVHSTPFSRIKSTFANITEDDARAKGYLKGEEKKEETFALLKRSTTPTTIYKKQKLDRDDVVDITDFDVVAWLKSEMRMMLEEEIARAILVGDGRLSSSDDKVNEQNIRPIWKDEDLYTIKAKVVVKTADDSDARAKKFIRTAIKARKSYKGSGEPVLYTSEDVLTDCLLLEDMNGRVIYDSVSKLATSLRVREIVTVPVMEGLSREDGANTLSLMGLIVNLRDYNIGADKGGSVNMFDDFDIDYNAQKYLIETRCSGALVKPYSAIALELSEEAEG